MNRSVALALLGFSKQDPTKDEIIAAYKAAIQLNHPDRYNNNERLRAHAEEQCKLINEAREVLLNNTWKSDFWEEQQSNQNDYSSRNKKQTARETENAYQKDSSPETKETPRKKEDSGFLSKWPTWLRWVLAYPIAILSAGLMNVLVSLFASFIIPLFGLLRDVLPEEALVAIIVIAGSALWGYVFVTISAMTAPSHQKTVAIISACLVVLFAGVSIGMVVIGTYMYPDALSSALVVIIEGAAFSIASIVAAVQVNKKEKE